MKEFEKWIEQKTFYHKDTEFHIAASFAWKAALEWALKSGYVDDYGDDIINSWDIEEELGEHNENRI